MDLDDILSETEDLISERLATVTDALGCVATVESIKDADANLKDAADEALKLIAGINALRARIKEQGS